MEGELVLNKNIRRLKAVWSIQMTEDFDAFHGVLDEQLLKELRIAGLKVKRR